MALKAHIAVPIDDEHSSGVVTALLATQRLSDETLQHVRRVLAEAEIVEFRPVEIVLTPEDVPAGPIAEADRLQLSITAALERGRVYKENLAGDPSMLTTAEMAKRLGMSEEGVRQKRRRHEIVGLQLAKRGYRYPDWQILPDGRVLPELPRIAAILGNDTWRLYRFLLQYHQEAGARAVDALKRGRIRGVLAAAENTASGAFA